jgi:pyruvate formate lyase activating enzyme
MDQFTVPTRYWHALDDGRVQCDVCPRACKLRDGQRGLCFVRERRGDGIVLTSHGRSSGFCVDPVEKKPFNHFLPGSSIFSFGTAGCISADPRADFYAHLDAANVDLKAFNEDFYRHQCGAELGAVLDSLEYLHSETDVWVELTTLLIPGLNDGDDELDRMTTWVVEHLGVDVPMHFTAFHPDFKLLDRPPTPPETLARARRIAKGNGVRHAYTGNVHDAEGQSTYCAGCGEPVIGRDWYEIGAYRLDDDGRCLGCGSQLPGVFDGPPGGWGQRRRRIVLDRVPPQRSER